MKALFLAFLFSALTTQAQVWEQAIETLTPPTDYEMRLFQESDFSTVPWLKEFTQVLVINKANTGADRQTLRIYLNGKLDLIAKISTGRETYEKGCDPGQDPKKDHCSIRSYWSTTPTGYFDIDKLVENHFSNLWKTWMPYSVFFEGGIATHQAPAGTESKLGSRASGGCVRSHPNTAPVVFKKIQTAGMGLVPKINRDGTVQKTKQGDIVRWQGYKTLVIVQNVVVQ